MSETQSLSGEFFETVKSLFELQNFEIMDFDESKEREHGFDLLVNRNDIKSVVQTKLFRSRFAANSSIVASARQLSDAARRMGAVYSIMFVTARVDANALLGPNGEPGVCVFDYDAIGLLLRPYPDLLSRFRELVRKAALFSDSGSDAFLPQAFPVPSFGQLCSGTCGTHDDRLQSSYS